MALSVQYATFYLVPPIKQTSLSNQKQAVCSFLEHIQSYKIGLIFTPKTSIQQQLGAFSETWNARKWERVMEFISLFIFHVFCFLGFRAWVSMMFRRSNPPCRVSYSFQILCWTPFTNIF